MKSKMIGIMLLFPMFMGTLNGQAITLDFSQPATITQIRALPTDGYANITLRAMAPTGTFDMNFCANVMHAVLAQVGVSIYVTPAPSQNATVQVHTFNNGLYNCNFFTSFYWLQVVNPTKWLDVKSNVQFISDFVTESYKVYHQEVGIFTTADDWNAITGGVNITELSGLYHPLWYRGSVPDENFNDFKSFGGWLTPAMKQLKPVVVEKISGNSNLFAHNW